MTPHGHFVWNELNTRDPDAAKRFYGETVGWTFDAMPIEGGTYWIAKVGDKATAGIFTMDGPQFEGMPNHWLAYLEVDDVDQRAAAVPKSGGTILRAPWTIPEVGRVAIVRDATGAGMGWMTSAPRP